MGLGGVSFGFLMVVFIIAGAFVFLVMAALVKYVFGQGKGSRNTN